MQTTPLMSEVLLAGEVEIVHSLEVRGGEPEETANPVQTSAIFGVKRGCCGDAVDAGFPLQYDDFPLGRALSSAG